MDNAQILVSEMQEHKMSRIQKTTANSLQSLVMHLDSSWVDVLITKLVPLTTAAPRTSSDLVSVAGVDMMM